MYKYLVEGGKPLRGQVNISGSKNAAVAILPAATLVDGVCRIENIPKISDVTLWLEILSDLGVKVRLINDTTVEIDASHMRTTSAPFESMRQMRASYYLIGALLGRFGSASVSMPGGCDFGVRPIDQHIKGFEALGATTEVKNGLIIANSQGRLTGSHIYLDVPSVGATINIMLAACLADGLTLIENPAKEPHVVDVANFLNSMGADIKGAGTDLIKIRGVSSLTGGTYTVIPDQIEAGTFMAIAGATKGDITVKNVIPKHLECITAKLSEIGLEISESDDSVRVCYNGALSRANIKTNFYPGFPTDMQPQIASLLCLAEGTSVITEGVWDNRYRYVDELKRMGAHIQVDGKVAVIEGVGSLSAAPVRACDLRAGAALIVASLSAEGVTEIDGLHHIERGYEDIIDKLRELGAKITRAELELPSAVRQA